MFQHTYPEVQDSGTLPIYGQTLTINGVPMAKLRLRQLRDLARAFQIPIDLDAPKDQILPALTAAAMAGMFKKKPTLEYYWRRAHRTGDEKEPFEHPEFKNPDVSRETFIAPQAPVAAAVPTNPVDDAEPPYDLNAPAGFVQTVTPEDKALTAKYAHYTFTHLRALAKKARPDVTQFGVSRLELARMIDDYVKINGREPGLEPVNVPNSQ